MERIGGIGDIGELEEMLLSEDREKVRCGLDTIKEKIGELGAKEARPLFGALTALFYIDPLDRPDLKPCLDEAIDLVVGFGDWVIPRLLESLDDSDVKAQIVIANALGRLGADAIDPLLEAYAATDDSDRRSFLLYALGHVRSPKVRKALPVILQAMAAPSRVLRDSATRTVGRMMEAIPSGDLTEEEVFAITEALRLNLGDHNPGIRSKAVRSLGKLARYGHLNHDRCEWAYMVLQKVLGKDGSNEWDRAYIVRREAREAMSYCQRGM
ncbi:MAG: hypothetical protein GXP47_03165 [Acidobacteria bacterium]|nr:hypothetical protein [Acidobacteriota bacterium]